MGPSLCQHSLTLRALRQRSAAGVLRRAPSLLFCSIPLASPPTTLSAGVYAVITPSPFFDEDVCDLIAEAIAPRETRSFQEQRGTGEVVFLRNSTPSM